MLNTLNELPVFFGAFYGGLLIGILYDVFRLLRLPFRSRLLNGIFDALFYAGAGALAALCALALNGGIPRFFVVFGLFLGAFLWQISLSCWLRTKLLRYKAQKSAKK